MDVRLPVVAIPWTRAFMPPLAPPDDEDEPEWWCPEWGSIRDERTRPLRAAAAAAAAPDGWLSGWLFILGVGREMGGCLPMVPG